MAKDKNLNYDYLTINIKYENAISLFSFKESLDGWYAQYNKHLEKSKTPKGEETLLIKEIKKGSIIITLISTIVPLLSEASNVITFFSAVKHVITWLSTKKGKKPKYDIEELENIKKIVAPITNIDNSINITVNGDNSTGIAIDKVIAQVTRQNADSEIKKLAVQDEPVQLTDESNRDNVILKFTQIEGTEKNNRNTKAIISSIDSKSHPVTFGEGLKKEVILGTENPLIKNYLVNVKEHHKNNEVSSYTILTLLDSYYDEPEADLFSEKE